MLLDMGFVENEAALAARYPSFCARSDWGLLGAFEGARLLGYAAAHDHGQHLRSGDAHRKAYLHDLYTLPDARQRGVGRALMRAVEGWARARPVRYVEWYANTHSASPAYERMGYVGAPSGQDGFLFFEIDFGPRA